MPRRFFRKFALNRERFRRQWYLSPFEHLLHDHNLWGIRRRTVVPAFSLGLLVAYFPFPGHPLFAALLALLFRVNIPIAALTTFVSNPLTMGPMYFLAYRAGLFLLGTEPQPFAFELSMDWVMQRFVTIWQPMLVGCVLLGSLLALAGYIVLDLLWRASIADYLENKRRER
ncbi:MAG: DUF2062 domain-containing protein [Gammaproteobacteria bacterium]|nr:DUF2062 domain-containing protein [Gammaproteobacteria bacterium]MDH4255501.1 DUF2062 domain-containing protein [Gammaproteobacteria bacterium]MDH5312030.1 DUF2062 domain-containing protein [Gammaproteobacteria bacterium]